MNCSIGHDVAHAAKLLRDGKLVAFATETVYGLGADALDPGAVARIFEAKGRPRFDPLIVHVAARRQVDDLVESMSPAARLLADRFWPGPLTLVLPKSSRVPDLVTAGLPSVAVRIPDHPQALDLLRQAGMPVAAPSANLFGSVSPTTAEHVAEQLGDRIDYILDGGPCRVGLESTVLFAGNGPLTLLRPGGLPLEEIEAVAGPVHVPVAGSSRENVPQLAPGMLLRHYAPRAPVTIVANEDELPSALARLRAEIPSREGGEVVPRTIAVLSLKPVSPVASRENESGVIHWESLSPMGDLREAASGFFAAIRRLDTLQPHAILALRFPDEGLGRALNDRLRRAARGESPA